MSKTNDVTIKKWIELPQSLVAKIAAIAEREHRTEKGQIEHMVAEHVRQIEEDRPNLLLAGVKQPSTAAPRSAARQ